MPRNLLLSPSVEVDPCKPEPSESASTIVDDFISTAAATNSCWILLIFLLKAYVIVIVESVCKFLCNGAIGTIDGCLL